MFKKASVIAVLILVVVTTAAIHSSLSQGNSDKLPAGKWAISARPYVGTAYESQPVKVIGTVSDPTQGFKVRTVGLKNTSGKVVSAVKLRWYVTSEQSGDSILLQGDTQPLQLGKGLAVGKSEYFDFPVLSFGKVSKPLMKAGSLQGVFSIEVAVSEILYDDGSTWEGDPKNTVTFAKAGLRPGPLPPDCPNLACTWNIELQQFGCTGSQGLICTPCRKFCTNTVCGELAPPCGPGGGE